MEQYCRTIARFGSEFGLLLHTPPDEIRQASPLLGEAVERIRSGRVIRKPGFDGEYGVIRVFEKGERERLAGQESLFGDGTTARRARKKQSIALALPVLAELGDKVHNSPKETGGPNPEQAAAITSGSRHILVTAGPGTGKTYTLTQRMAALLAGGHDPARMVAITFTVKAADEVRERLLKSVGLAGERVFVGTFHQFCLHWLRRAAPPSRWSVRTAASACSSASSRGWAQRSATASSRRSKIIFALPPRRLPATSNHIWMNCSG